MGHYCIEVEGEIIAYSKKHFVQNWSCCDIGKPIKDKNYQYDKDAGLSGCSEFPITHYPRLKRRCTKNASPFLYL